MGNEPEPEGNRGLLGAVDLRGLLSTARTLAGVPLRVGLSVTRAAVAAGRVSVARELRSIRPSSSDPETPDSEAP